MTTPIIWTETTNKVCNLCGALVGDVTKHADWHKSEPAEKEDAWEESIAKFSEELGNYRWTGHLISVVTLLTFSLQELDAGNIGMHKLHAVNAAASVRAMAPKGTEWAEPWPVSPGQERSVIRAALRSMIKADNCHEHAHDNEIQALISAEAYLHGLWLEGVED